MTSAGCATGPSSDTPPALADLEARAACPPYPDGYESYPALPTFDAGETWDAWGDEWMNFGLTVWGKLQAQKKWRDERWKNCKLP